MRSGRLLNPCDYRLFLRRIYGVFCIFIISTKSCIAAELTVADAWVRLAPPSARVNAAYMSLVNKTDKPILITGVNADCCAMAMLHQTKQDSETASMIHLDQLEIPPRTTTQLKPGGLHIMLMRPKQPLSEGDLVQLGFTLGDGSVLRITAPVRPALE